MKNFKTDRFVIITDGLLKRALNSETLCDFYKELVRLSAVPTVAWGVIKNGKFEFKTKPPKPHFLHQELTIQEEDQSKDLAFKNQDTTDEHPVSIRFMAAAPNNNELEPLVDILHSKHQHNLYRRLLQKEEVNSVITKLLSLDGSYILDRQSDNPDGSNTMAQVIKLSPKCLPVIAQMLMMDLFVRTPEQIDLIKKEMIAIGVIGGIVSESVWDKGIDAYKKIAAPYIDRREGYVDEKQYDSLEDDLTKDTTWMEFFRILIKHIFQRLIETITFSKYEENQYNEYNRREAFKYLYNLIKNKINERNIAKAHERALSDIEETERQNAYYRRTGFFEIMKESHDPVVVSRKSGDTPVFDSSATTSSSGNIHDFNSLSLSDAFRTAIEATLKSGNTEDTYATLQRLFEPSASASSSGETPYFESLSSSDEFRAASAGASGDTKVDSHAARLRMEQILAACHSGSPNRSL
jgi:hypothetical protein